jgi:lysyl-tRNA synthetase class 1
MPTATIENPIELRQFAEQSHAWPFDEARKIVARLKRMPKDEVIFETGYGPSGLPHIGTFGEVARTTMVRHAFRVLTDDKIKTRLIAFSDDMDGLRKVPDNVPNKEMVAAHLGKPLTKVPDPFGTHDSFAAHNNARLRAFLDQFGFDYEFMSSTACYTSGRFDAALLKVLERFDAVMNIMLPSLREERAESYSPFLPISPVTGIVLQVPVVAHDAKAGTITYEDPDSKEHVTTLVTGGRCKLQWKPDWAMRWVALGVDYEMAGKDLIDSVKLSGEICRALGGMPPEGFNYELFLDETGQKISKSKGNGLTIDEWLRYASPESLSLFMYREPKAAKRLYFDVIPRHVDEYLQFLDAYGRQAPKEQLGNPVWHIHGGAPPKADNPVPFAMLLSLVTASNAENADTLWGFIGRYRPGVTQQSHQHLAAMVDYAIHYFRDFVLPAKKYREPTDVERAALLDLRDALSQLPPDATAEAIQDVVYEVGRREPFLDQKKKGKDGKPGVSLDWFNLLYQVLLGQEKGPRFGSFVAAYGVKNTMDMIDGALARSDTQAGKADTKGLGETVKRFTDAGRQAIKSGNLYAALSLALMIPDICASLEDPGPEKSKKRYEAWCKKWVEPKFTKPARGAIPQLVFISAEDCYQLRCSLIHSGSDEIPGGQQNTLNKFFFFDQTAGSHMNKFVGLKVNGVQQPDFLQLKADQFSETIFAAADEWDVASEGNPTVKREKAKLLTIHTSGDVINGVKFG